MMLADKKNRLYYGDNLEVLRLYVADESVDLVYLDPPFNSNRDYNVLFAEQDGSRAASQIKAFGDTWRWDQAAARAYEEVVETGGDVSRALQAFRTLLGDSDMLAYLTMMAPRLVELRRVMKPTASIYLHCDCKASACLRLLMDAVFEPKNFRNEIIWHKYKGVKNNASSKFPTATDTILYYAGGPKPIFNLQYQPLSDSHVEKKYKYTDDNGRKYALAWGRTYQLTGENKKLYLDESLGTPITTLWDGLYLNTSSSERLGYPTQKPEALLERIIQASSNEGDLLLDPFCGCGTTIAVAQRLGRRWIGIDVTHLAINLIKTRLRDAHGEAVAETYEVIGEPTSVEDAAALAQEDPWQFQAWALGLVGARPAGPTKKGADKGIDGRLYFHDKPNDPTRQIVISVKAGGVTVSQVRDLRGVLDREQAEIGVLLSFEQPTAPMRREAASAGFYTSAWGTHPRIQLLTIAELLSGKRIDYPPATQTNVTFARAERAAGEHPKTIPLALKDRED